jgi:hypothetical protein
VSSTIRIGSAVSKRKLLNRRPAPAAHLLRIAPNRSAASSLPPSSGLKNPTPTVAAIVPPDQREIDPEGVPRRGNRPSRKATPSPRRRAAPRLPHDGWEAVHDAVPERLLAQALNERLPDAYKLLPPAGHPGPGEGRRLTLRQVVADRRAARTSRYPDAPAPGLADWLADRQQQADQQAERARPGAVGERRVAEALRARATDPDSAAGRQEPGVPPAERERDWQDQEHQREPEDDFGDSWHTYRERADQIRRTCG